MPKFGWFIRLKDSARNSIRKRSPIAKLRDTPKSRFTNPGPRRMLRPELPKQTQVEAAKAVRSNQWLIVRWSEGRAPSRRRLGRAVVLVPLGSVLDVTVNGWPV